MQFWWRWMGTRFGSFGNERQLTLEMATSCSAQRKVSTLVSRAAGCNARDASPMRLCQHGGDWEQRSASRWRDGGLEIRYVRETAIWGKAG